MVQWVHVESFNWTQRPIKVGGPVKAGKVKLENHYTRLMKLIIAFANVIISFIIKF